MPKRGRDGDVMVQMAPGDIAYGSKRHRPCHDAFFGTNELSNRAKRPASFETEIRQMNKRLRATIPTAEEAIAFLLPHMSKLDKLYKESLVENQRLKDHVTVLAEAYEKTRTEHDAMHKVARDAAQQIASLQRQLEMVKYRFAYFHRSNIV
tara:strand:- start:974 stop:1426 length:453 start_codon:yes stop_codon:yes gene_type:complete